MARRYSDDFLANLKERLDRGASVRELAQEFSFSPNKVVVALRDRLNYILPSTRRFDEAHARAPEIVRDYDAGISALALAERFDVSRATIYSILQMNGIVARGGSASMRVRLGKLSRDELAALSRNARAARLDNLGKAAREKAKHRAIGQGERELFELLDASGFNPRQQVSMDGNAIDIVFGSVTVEVKFSSSLAFQRRGGEFDKQLIEGGRTLVYFGINSATVIAAAAGEIVALLDFIRGQPAPAGQYWVIRCALDSRRVHSQADDVSLVPVAPQVTTSISKRYLG